MSLTSNPNYGETTIPNPNGEDFIDLAPKQVCTCYYCQGFGQDNY